MPVPSGGLALARSFDYSTCRDGRGVHNVNNTSLSLFFGPALSGLRAFELAASRHTLVRSRPPAGERRNQTVRSVPRCPVRYGTAQRAMWVVQLWC
jgi:hypothetical protein